ncbi:MAG TPA: hypothetical protein VGN18_10775 [Jatrophihabitans sp.]|jgi:hypothetical protein|uniref:hypothetical protein n=1 Tax=Jatrophihabitans sp. TaxID=1932789 RepID=UPI002E095433|nr:hypothetical protein [Jatrophihabitans sp.]
MVSRFEIRKDTAQVIAESAATHVGRIATILTGAVRDLTHEVGEWASDVFEIREAAGRAAQVHERGTPQSD